MPEHKIVLGMALMRFLSAAIELAAAIIMLKAAKVTSALRINACLGLVGPCILIGVTLIGLPGMAQKVSMIKIAIIAIGVALVLYGSQHN
jgi:hypothetical protein